MYGTKIRMVRELRGYSQEYVASKLGIAQNSYSKIETDQTKLTAENLQKIADVLEVSPMDIMSQQPTIVNMQSNLGAQGINHVENFYTFQKDVMDKIMASKDAEIARLEKIVESLLKK